MQDSNAVEHKLAPQISKGTVLKYLKRRADEISDCRTALNDGNWETLERSGHRIKGNAETFGMAPLAAPAQQLEESAQNHDKPTAEASLDQLADLIGTELEKFFEPNN